MARPTKLTPQVIEMVTKALKAGNFRETAARYAGVDPGQFYRWMDRGAQAEANIERLSAMSREELIAEARRKGIRVRMRTKLDDVRTILIERERLFREFREAVELAIAEAEVDAVYRLRLVAQSGNTKAAVDALKFYLERAHRDRWGRHDKLTIENLTVDELDAEIKRLEAELGMNDPAQREQ